MAKKKYEEGDLVSTDGFVEEFCTKPVFDEDGVQVSAGIGRDGREYGDPVPMAPPVGFGEPVDFMSMLRSIVRSERFLERSEQEGFDSFEEAGDFDIDDDPMPPLSLHEAILAGGPPPVQENRPQDAAPPSPSSSAGKVTAGQEGSGAGVAPTPPAPAPSDVKSVHST